MSNGIHHDGQFVIPAVAAFNTGLAPTLGP